MLSVFGLARRQGDPEELRSLYGSALPQVSHRVSVPERCLLSVLIFCLHTQGTHTIAHTHTHTNKQTQMTLTGIVRIICVGNVDNIEK